MKILPQSTYSPPTQTSVRTTNTKQEAMMNLEEGGSSSKIADEGHEDMERTETDQRGGEEWIYDIESTFEELDYEDRKWLLFELILTEQWSIDDIKSGSPMNLVPTSFSPEDVEKDQSERSNDIQIPGNTPRRRIQKLEEEWLLIFCQIDVLPYSERDEFLLNLFLISSPHAIELIRFSETLEMGRAIQEINRQHEFPDNEMENEKEYQDGKNHFVPGVEEVTVDGEVKVKEKEKEQWLRQFRDHTKERRREIGSAMKATHGRIKRWKKLRKDREGVFDIAMEVIGIWLNRPLPYFHPDAAWRVESGGHGQCQGKVNGSQCPEMSNQDGVMGKAKGKGKAKLEQESDVDDYNKMYAFEASTKILSLLEKIVAQDAFLFSSNIMSSSRSRYQVIGLHDLVRLLVVIARSPVPLRSHLGEVVEMISIHIVGMFKELDEVTQEWMRIDEDIRWDLKMVNDGLGEVELDWVWAEVMDVIGVARLRRLI